MPKIEKQQKPQPKRVQKKSKKPKGKKRKYRKNPIYAAKQGWMSRLIQRWVLKKTLQAQGYYEGATHLWLTRASADSKPQPKNKHFSIAKAQKKASTSSRSKGSQKNSNMQWRVKTVKLQVEAIAKADIKIVSPPSQVKTKLTRVQKGKWVPKAPAIPTTTKIEAKFLCSSSKELMATPGNMSTTQGGDHCQTSS